MFTGIIDHYGIIRAIERTMNGLKALIECEFTDLIEGESIAVDGVCLTATQPQTKQFSCDISPETLNLTTAKDFKPGRKVNLERSLRMGDRMGGHWVMGHVDQRGMIKKIVNHAEFTEMHLGGIPAEHMQYMLKKGSIAVNGVSLTVNEVSDDGFQVMLIPHTLMRTNLNFLSVNDEVNLEFDLMVRVLVKKANETVKENVGFFQCN